MISASPKAFPIIWSPTGNLFPSEFSSNPAGTVMAGRPVQHDAALGTALSILCYIFSFKLHLHDFDAGWCVMGTVMKF